MNLHKSASNRMFAGVCGGLAETLGVNATWIRLLFFLGGGVLLWVYLGLAIALPEP
ncbi:PspC domain-containing protein [Lacticaseibacillus daqingensis]|uniref:PspC domain-containing protein n=1 Tax=Lacticaseibacillus daqingensis TaxID=2486014 RepID=UPI000F79B570|nr:PspC domain-containing protein [Lacticaseibacillus daqingensis]